MLRQLLLTHGLNAGRIARVTGQADQDPSFEERDDVRNNRVEIILLR